MKSLWKMSIGLGAVSAFMLMSGYFADHHRCKQVNYDQSGFEMPSTLLISAKQCLAAANAVNLRGYARNS